MSKYVKSYSNYVLKTKHQETNDGIIYERDITTIGGRDHFAAGQIPIYKSGNFVITVNNENSTYKKTVLQNWEGNESGDIWTLDILKNYEKDEKSSYDEKIVIKKDYYDLRDFAYYGSCSELIRGSINNIIDEYPGELFIPIIYTWQVKEGDNVLYVAYSKEAADSYIDGNTALTKVRIENSMSVTWSDYKNWATWLVKNNQGDVLYVAYSEEDAEIYKDGDESLIIEKINYDNDSENGDNGYASLPVSREFIFPPNVAKSKSGTKLFAIDNPFNIDIHSSKLLDKTKPLKYFAEDGYQNYVVYEQDSNGEWDFKNAYPITWMPLPMDDGKYCEKFDDYKYVPGDYMENVIISYINKDGDEIEIAVYVFMGDNNEIKYFVDEGHNKIRIRPNDKVINKFYDELSIFEKILVNRDTNFKATFEIIREDDYGYFIDTQIFTFPTTYGGYNLGSKDAIFSEYVERLAEIGAYYDENFSDNMWRSMTHEAIKNFDWTYTRHFTPGDEIEYVEGGEKIKKIIRLYGREFDEIKSYVDSIKENYNVTYDNINNLPDYFFTDKLEDDGWDVRLVNPLELTEYVNGESAETISREDEIRNKVDDDPIKRVFSDYKSTVKPYTRNNITSVGSTKCSSSEISTIDFEGVCDFNEDCDTTAFTLTANVGESHKDGYHDNCCGVVKIYSSENDYTPADVNSEFFKRFILNSKNILRHKGTIEGIEMLLSLFGMKSKNYVFTNDTYFQVNGSSIELTDLGKKYYNKTDLNSAEAYDFDIKEYTLFTNRKQDGTLKYDETTKKWVINEEGNISWLNSLKLTRTSGSEGNPYNGLPVIYRDKDVDSNHKERYIYPSFQNYLPYDGGLYYQMNGGWLSKNPLMFDNDNNIIPVDYKKDNERYEMLFTETVKNVKCVQTLEELFSNKNLAENTGDICEVIDLSGEYAIIDGFVYRLYKDTDNNLYYFTVTVDNNSLSVGESFFTDYVIISNPYGENNLLRINLNDNTYNGKTIRVYVINDNVDIHSDVNTISTFTLFKDGKYMAGDNYSHYFRLNNPDFSNELSVMGWQQLKTDEYEYYIMNSVKDYDKGNNPHTGHMKYDKGHEYLLHFSRLFKPIYENNLFDLNAVDRDVDVYSESYQYGFTNLVSDDDCNTDYDYLLQEDDKCHYFGDYFYNEYSSNCVSGSTSIPDIHFGKNAPKYKNSECTPTIKEIKYGLDDDSSRGISGGSFVKATIRKTELGLGTLNQMKYGDKLDDTSKGEVDGVTNQIVNTKRVDIDFYLNSRKEYSKEWLEEVKYIDSVILPYVEQMLPSTIIVTVNYKNKHKKIGS